MKERRCIKVKTKKTKDAFNFLPRRSKKGKKRRNNIIAKSTLVDILKERKNKNMMQRAHLKIEWFCRDLRYI